MRIWIIRKKSIWIGVVALIALLSFLWMGQNRAVTVSKTQRDLPIYCVDKGDEKVISISFDAAWGNGRYGLLILQGLSIHILRYNFKFVK